MTNGNKCWFHIILHFACIWEKTHCHCMAIPLLKVQTLFGKSQSIIITQEQTNNSMTSPCPAPPAPPLWPAAWRCSHVWLSPEPVTPSSWSGPLEHGSMAACEANYQRIFLCRLCRPGLTSNSLIWTSCGRMWLSWLKVLTATVSPLCLLTPCNPSQWHTFENMHDGKGRIGITNGVKWDQIEMNTIMPLPNVSFHQFSLCRRIKSVWTSHEGKY